MDALNKRYGAFNMEAMKDPRVLTKPEGRAAIRAQLADYRKLADETAAEQQVVPDQTERLIAALPAGEFKRGTDVGFHKKVPELRSRIAAVRRAQNALADSIEGIIDWCATENPKFGVDGQHLALTNPQRETLNVVTAKVEEAAKNVVDTAKAMQDLQKRA